MIEKTAWDVRKYPEKFAVYRILCNFAVVFQNCINSMESIGIIKVAINASGLSKKLANIEKI